MSWFLSKQSKNVRNGKCVLTETAFETKLEAFRLEFMNAKNVSSCPLPRPFDMSNRSCPFSSPSGSLKKELYPAP